ncbi:gliding motility-associated-like protein [Dyadobacter jejuensis]|uniref:Gliding motility-associated-like protein n=1 Tax=Dyadobacter jejuensis TaxID=1082580 RepID=A0A316B700_9BACT|nr:gliding motility-associated C-terminal domain-containing protein [Dyadobacter jejuensis]PWJ58357.1 gliding motility-associated-like protein [Dyadobacter jejuensis]
MINLYIRLGLLLILSVSSGWAQSLADTYRLMGNFEVDSPACGNELAAVRTSNGCNNFSSSGQFVEQMVSCNTQRKVYNLFSDNSLLYDNSNGLIGKTYTIQFLVSNSAWPINRAPVLDFSQGNSTSGIHYKRLGGGDQACLSLDDANFSNCIPLNLNEYYLISITRNDVTGLVELYVNDQLVASKQDPSGLYCAKAGASIRLYGNSSKSTCESASAYFAFLSFANTYRTGTELADRYLQACSFIHDNPNADFSIDPGNSCKDGKATIQYTGTLPMDSPYALEWDFDGAQVLNGTGRGPIDIQWSTAGTKNVKLSIVNKACSQTLDNIKSPIVSLPSIEIDQNITGCSPIQNVLIRVKDGAPPYQYALNSGAYRSDPSFSLPQGIHSFYIKDTNGCIRDTSVTVTGRNIKVESLPDTTICEGQTITLLTTSDGSSFVWSPNSNIDHIGIQSPTVTPQASTSYIVHAKSVDSVTGDDCEATDTVRVTVLPRPQLKVTPGQIIEPNNPFQLSATVSNATGVTFAWTPPNGLDDPTSPTPTATLDQDQKYRVVAANVNGCSEDATVYLQINKRMNLKFPEAFSPNGDGINDHLLPIYDPTITLKHMRIYGRWGAPIFESNTPLSGWNGLVAQSPAESGTYQWVLEGELPSGESVRQTGTLLLLR